MSTDIPIPSERASKLRRLEALRRDNPHVSASALSALLEDIEQNGLPDLTGKKHVKEARDYTLEQHKAYGPMLETVQLVNVDGTSQDMVVVNMCTLLQAMFQMDGGMTSLIKRTILKTPCSVESPWHLIYYSDEVVPGNVLSADVSRKVQCVYISIMEFGPLALSREESWMCILAKRSSHVAQAESGMSQVTAKVLQHILHHPLCDTVNQGVLLKDSNGSRFRVWIALGAFLQDGAAHKQVFNLKGDAGTKFCVFCRNLVSQKSGLVDEAGDILVATSWDLASIQQSTDESLRDTVSRLDIKHETLNTKEFALWQQAVGMNYNKHDLLHCQALFSDVRPIAQLIHDWMHCFIVSGCYQTVMYLLLAAMEEKFGTDIYQVLGPCIKQWNQPQSKKSSLDKLFEKKRKVSNKAAATFKCTASEALGLLPLVSYFLFTSVIPHGHCLAECNAYFALADLIELIQLIPLGRISPDSIAETSSTFIAKCIDANWESSMHTKFHWVLHMAGHLRKHKMLPSCFVQERKHKVVKRALVLSSGNNAVSGLLVFGGLLCMVVLLNLRV